jgi:hypothetical protein
MSNETPYNYQKTPVELIVDGAPVSGLNPLPVGTGDDREIVKSVFKAIGSGTGYGAGDLIAQIVFFDVSSDTPVVDATVWYNMSTSAVIAEPDAADLEQIQSQGLTDDELRASPVAVQAGGYTVNPTATFTRPADTTAYDIGDLVANSVTAGSVVPMELTAARIAEGSGLVRRVKVHKSGTTTANAVFRVHLFKVAPASITNGDGGAFSVSGAANYIGRSDVILSQPFTDGAAGFGTPLDGFEMNFKLASGQTVFALIEARGTYTPANAEVFTVTLEVSQD